MHKLGSHKKKLITIRSVYYALDFGVPKHSVSNSSLVWLPNKKPQVHEGCSTSQPQICRPKMVRQSKRNELNCKTHRQNSTLCCCCFRVAPKNISFKLTQNRKTMKLKNKTKQQLKNHVFMKLIFVCARCHCWMSTAWSLVHQASGMYARNSKKNRAARSVICAPTDRNVPERLAIKQNKYCAHGARSSRQQQ